MRYLVLTLALIGCTQEQPKANALKRERIEAAKAIAEKPPQPRTYMIQGNQLVVVEVASADRGFVDMQKCYIWRDQEYKTSSISCPSEQSTEPVRVLGESEKNGY